MAFIYEKIRTMLGIKDNIRIVLTGPSGAGKTTLATFLQTGKTVEKDPRITLGVNVHLEPIVLNNFSIKLVDLAGNREFMSIFAEQHFKDANAIIILIDSTLRRNEQLVPEKDPFIESVANFNRILDFIGEDIPTLIMVNKMDLKDKNPMSLEEAAKLYDMQRLSGSYIVLKSSAKYGTIECSNFNALDEAILWLATQSIKTKRK